MYIYIIWIGRNCFHSKQWDVTAFSVGSITAVCLALEQQMIRRMDGESVNLLEPNTGMAIYTLYGDPQFKYKDRS